MQPRRPGDELLEQLLVLRSAYRYRSTYDRDPTLDVQTAIEYGELRMRLSRVAHGYGRWQVPRVA